MVKVGYLKVKSCQKMTKFLKITNSPIGLDKRHHFVLLAEGV